jgi:hypothetical protein
MAETEKTRADAHMDAALAQSTFEDPRPAFRDRLRLFREEQPDAFAAALQYYENVLVPAVAAAESEPLSEWVQYGRRLGELSGPGKTMAIDTTGRARTHSGAARDGELLMHIPHDTATQVLALAVPRQLSPAQQATLDLLVHRARGLE